MIAPITLVLVLVAIYPFLYSVRLSLTNAHMANYANPEFVGLRNYISILESAPFWHALALSLIYVALAVTVETGLGLGLAMLADKARRLQRVFVSGLIAPMLISTVLAGVMFRLELNPTFGIIARYVEALGFKSQLLGPDYALPTMIAIDIWQWTSFMFLILYAGLRSLPNEPYEAARVYGASKWQILRYVTLPLLRPVLLVAVIFRTMDAFKAFDHIYTLTAGGPGDATTTISILAYNFAYKMDDFGRASALAVILLVVVILISKFLLRFLSTASDKTKERGGIA